MVEFFERAAAFCDFVEYGDQRPTTTDCVGTGYNEKHRKFYEIGWYI